MLACVCVRGGGGWRGAKPDLPSPPPATDLEQLRLLEAGIPMRVAVVGGDGIDGGNEAIGVDLPEHVEAVEAALRKRRRR